MCSDNLHKDYSDFNDKEIDCDDLLLDDILAEFCSLKEENQPFIDDKPVLKSENKQEISIKIPETNAEIAKVTEPTDSKNQDEVLTSLIDLSGEEKKENGYKELSTNETLNKNKLDEFFYTFYSE